MNERIRELAVKAKLMAEEDINRQISYNTELKAFAEKFAELLVRECLAIVRKEALLTDYVPAEMNEHAGKRLHDAYVIIKEHFGVEE